MRLFMQKNLNLTAMIVEKVSINKNKDYRIIIKNNNNKKIFYNIQ